MRSLISPPPLRKSSTLKDPSDGSGFNGSDGQRDRAGRTTPCVALGGQRPAMSSDDRPANRQAQAHALRLGRDERLEYHTWIVEADPIVGNLNHDVGLGMCRL